MVNNNNNPVKRALDDKINTEFENKEYDLIVHFKGFNNLFKKGVYNGKGKEHNSRVYEDSEKDTDIDDIAKQYIRVIKIQLDQNVGNKNLLLVWDGDDLGETQWTRVMIATAKKLKEQGANLEFLCIPENEDKLDNIQTELSKKYELPETKINYILQTEINIQSVGWAVAGMCNMYVTSKINRTNNQPILVLCAGGGATPLDEYKFMNRKFEIPSWENKETNKSIYNNVIKLADDNMPDNFKWMASSKVHSRKNEKKDNGVELSQMIPENGIKIIEEISTNYPILTRRGGARKKRTKKKKKSLKKKSNKGKSKRKC